jgi:hypothetical protein
VIATSGNDVVKLLAGYADAFGGFGNTQAKIVKARFNQLAGVYRVLHFYGFCLLQ